MKKLSLVALIAATWTASHAVPMPFETEADRKPTLLTQGDAFIRAGRILTVTRGTIVNGQILVRGGKIVQIGTNLTPPAGIPVINATDQVVMPGIVDAHVHRGIDSTNEGADAISAEVRIEDVLDSDDLAWWQALASGETSGLALHGSSNPIGGQSVVIKFKYKSPVREAIFAGAPRQIKFALGENVTRMNSGAPSGPARFPTSRMGVEAVYRRSFHEARQYMQNWDAWNKSDRKSPAPRKDLRLETLADILRGKIWVQCHSYRADEIYMLARLSKEIGFRIGSMQHALEAYKVAPELARLGVPVSMFQDHWSFKLEAYDAIPAGPAICLKAGVLTSINTDGTSGTTALIYDAGKLMREGLTEAQALSTVTLNPAKQLGVDRHVGSIEVGKDADLAFYSGHPFNVDSLVMMTMIEGRVLFTRRNAYNMPPSPLRRLDLADVPDNRQYALPAPSNHYTLRDATLYPVNTGPISNGEIEIRDGKIVYVGARRAGNRGVVVSMGGLRVYPGLIDGGGAYGLSEIAGIRQMNDLSEPGDFQPDLVAASAVQAASAHIGPPLTNGMLTLVTRPAGGLVSGWGGLLRAWGPNTAMLTLRDRLAMQINVPAAPPPPPANPSKGCACFGVTLRELLDGVDHDHNHEERAIGDQDHEEEVGPMAQENEGNPNRQPPAAERFAGRLKQLDDYLVSCKKYADERKAKPTTPIDLRLEAMIPVMEGRVPVFMRTRTARSILNAIEIGKKHKLKVILTGAIDAWRVASEIKKSGYPVLLTPAGEVILGANSPLRAYDTYDSPYASPMALEKAGVMFGFQSDDNAQSMNLPNKVGMHTAYGLSAATGLRALTLNTARILGVSAEFGSIEPGKRATLFATNGDPLSATSQVKMIFIDGRPVPVESKHTRLRDQYLKRLDPTERKLSYW